MSFNPYLDPADESSEIIGDEDKNKPKESGGKSNQRHAIRGPNGEELPEEVQRTLGRYVNAWGDDSGSRMPVEFRAIQSLFEFFAGFSMFQEQGTLLLAIAEVVDGISNGDLGRVYRLHEAERVIMWTHSITRVENALESIFALADLEIHEIYRSELHLYFDIFLKIVKWFQERACNDYIAACNELGKEPDHEFVTSGILTERTQFQRVAMGHPSAKRDI